MDEFKKFKRVWWVLISIASVLALVMIVLIKDNNWMFPEREKYIEEKQPKVEQRYAIGRAQQCPGETKTQTMTEDNWRGLIPVGKEFNIITNYYACNFLKRDDWVYVQLSQQSAPLVRIARGVPGDKFDVQYEKDAKAWKIIVNGSAIKDVDGNVQYIGREGVAPVIKMYVEPRKGLLRTGEVILMSPRPPSTADSSIFGLYSLDDVLGKVEVAE